MGDKIYFAFLGNQIFLEPQKNLENHSLYTVVYEADKEEIRKKPYTILDYCPYPDAPELAVKTAESYLEDDIEYFERDLLIPPFLLRKKLAANCKLLNKDRNITKEELETLEKALEVIEDLERWRLKGALDAFLEVLKDMKEDMKEV